MARQDTPEHALYLRKSKGRAGIGRQRTTTTAHVEESGGRIAAEFFDTDRTAFRQVGAVQPKRDGFTAMLAMLAATPGLRVAAWHADRLTRNGEDTERLIEICATGDHLVVTRSGGAYDLSTANGRKRFRQDAVDASYEVDHSRERILAQKAEAAGEGRWLGGRRPFGWDIDKDVLDEDEKPVKGVLKLRPAEADQLRDAHADVLAGKSMHAIARDWNAAGLVTSTRKPWTATEVRRVLPRPMNAAPPPAQWPVILAVDTHRAIVGILSRPGRRTSPGPERKHLLSGLARCGTCGGGMIASSGSGAGRSQRTVYRCRADVQGVHVMRDKAALEDFITRLVFARFGQEDAAPLLELRTADTLGALRRERAVTEEAMAASNDLRRRHLLTAGEFAEERAEHMSTLTDLDGRIAEAEAVDALAPMLGDPAAAWARMDLDRRRAVVAELMTITIQHAPKGRPKGWRPGSGYFDPAYVEVEWKY
jgi:site-specific DNA recombinase